MANHHFAHSGRVLRLLAASCAFAAVVAVAGGAAGQELGIHGLPDGAAIPAPSPAPAVNPHVVTGPGPVVQTSPAEGGPAAARPALTVPAGGRAMTPTEIDDAIGEIFDSARKITHFQAELVTETYDTDTPEAQPRHSKQSYGFLRLSTPNLMWIQDYGEDERGRARSRAPRRPEESSYMIYDGKTYYDIQGVAGRNERPQGKREKIDIGQAANIAAVLGMYLGLDRGDVTSAAELRADFDLDGVLEPAAWDRGAMYRHIRLTPRRADADFVVEIWHRPGTVLPARAKMIEKKRIIRPGQRGEDSYVHAHTMRAMNGTKTNLDGLKPFGADAFALPRMEVQWDDER